MGRALALALLTICVAAAAAPQSQTAVIEGRVINAATRQPVRGAIVWIGRDATVRTDAGPPFVAGEDPRAPSPFLIELPGPGIRHYLTSSDGRFSIRDVAAGPVSIIASKHGFFSGMTGRRRPESTGVPLVIAAGARRTDVELLVWPQASISGTVTDERGVPMSGVRVVVSDRADDGRASLTGRIVAAAVTDDAGRYTVERLGTGEYIAGILVSHRAGAVGAPLYVSDPRERIATALLSANMTRFTMAAPHVIVGGRHMAYAGTFYGGVSDPAAAAVIALQDGDERTGVDLRLEPQPIVRIGGTVTGSSGSLARVALQLSSGVVTAAAASGADGSFAFENIPAGVYALRASRAASGGTPQQIAEDAPPVLGPFAANRDIDNLVVALGTGPTVSGTIIAPFDVDAERVRVRLHYGGSTTSAATARVSRGSFAFPEVPPGHYLVRVEGDVPDLTVESVEFRGRNVTDVPFEVATADVSGLVVHVTTRPAVVSGAVVRTDGKPSWHAAVALFPVDASTWSAPVIPKSGQFQTRRVSGGGYFFENVPRGDYYIVAVDDAWLRRWHDRSLLQKLSAQATRITVAPGAELRRDLTVEER